MRIGIISDTHDRIERTRHAVGLLQDAGAEVLIHCGDFTTPAIVSACALLPLYLVLGNNDVDEAPYLQQAADDCGATCLGWSGTVVLAGKRLGVTHGHLTAHSKRVLSESPHYFFTGHSHRADDHREGNVRCINPGALHRASDFSVALLNLMTDELKFLNVARG